MRRESFRPPATDPARRVRDRLASTEPRDDHAAALAAAWSECADQIEDLVRRAEELGELTRGRDHDFVICHADFHAWNVLVGPDDGLLVVDWDETLLAPVERDLMFVDDSMGSLDREGSDFFAGYGHVDPDPLLIAYYRFDWAVQEVADYGRRVLLSPDAGDATRAEAVQMFRWLFEPGDVVDAAFEAGARVRT
jgi:spectinomycin phosphotransferase